MDKPYNQYGYREPEKEKVQGKVRKRKGLYFVLLLVFLIILAFVVLFYSSLFELEGVELEGLDRIETEEIIRTLRLRRGMNIWEVNTRLIKAHLEDMPLVFSAEVRYRFPRSIVVSIVEKELVALAPYQDKYLELSQDGTLLGIVEGMKEEKPLLTGMDFSQPYIGKVLPVEQNQSFKEILEVLPLMSEEEISILSDFNVSNPLNLVVYTLDGTVIWMGTGDYPEKIRMIPEVLMEIQHREQEPSYIDLRVPHFLSK
ncbi:cell division protein FtsQ/DivIB [Candidatus Contubernalis alkaliaceticus]|uniref:cell division protein FtsQ/DivIB n=1 Tax=Candidatus Contubernalis alkaliaceticus TaxID=338645 RepID=UPI001F4C194C|nr:FtsQ-type POTRA domain-containing protein [Candidatus Contubernalis alkalaceticus]UNC92872.1 FtsQ-type POTRA domain-containing protein [Candidatus Contubernalis alkalaceticus]